MKLKIGFTIGAETLFSILSKMLPIENLKVEEIMEPISPTMAMKFTNGASTQHTIPEQRTTHINLKTGINKVILDMLENGPHHAIDFRKSLSNAGYSPNSISSRLQNLEKHGVVKRIGDGAWKLTEIIPTPNLPKPKRVKQVRREKGGGYKLNLYAGCNAIIMNALADGEPHPSAHIGPSIVTAGYAVNGLYGRLERLQRHGYILHPRSGYWQLTPKGKEAWDNWPHPNITSSSTT
jgi:DNA-binding PadR family transcriptional regulator